MPRTEQQGQGQGPKTAQRRQKSETGETEHKCGSCCGLVGSKAILHCYCAQNTTVTVAYKTKPN